MSRGALLHRQRVQTRGDDDRFAGYEVICIRAAGELAVVVARMDARGGIEGEQHTRREASVGSASTASGWAS